MRRIVRDNRTEAEKIITVDGITVAEELNSELGQKVLNRELLAQFRETSLQEQKLKTEKESKQKLLLLSAWKKVLKVDVVPVTEATTTRPPPSPHGGRCPPPQLIEEDGLCCQ